MEPRTFLIELQNRPDGVTNQSINSYSTLKVTQSTYYQRCATAVANTTFCNVTLIVLDSNGKICNKQNIETTLGGVPDVDEERLFLVELQNRPDGVVNQSLNTYSTPVMTRAMYHQRYAAALTNTTFTSVTLVVLDKYGQIYEDVNIITQYQPEE